MEQRILRIVRAWVIFGSVISIPVQIINSFREVDPLTLNDQLFHAVFILTIVGSLAWSYAKNMKSVYLAIICGQIRMYYVLFQKEGIIHSDDDKSQILVYSVSLIQVLVLNQIIICKLFDRHQHKLNILMFIILYLGFFYRMLGIQQVVDTINVVAIIGFISLVLGLGVFKAISMQRMEEVREINNMIYNLKTAQAKDKEMIFDSLDQGIMMVQDSTVIFQNEICSDLFCKVLGGAEILNDGVQLAESLLFKLFEQTSD